MADTYANKPYIYSTAHDLYKWDCILYTDKLLSKTYLKSYLVAHYTDDPDYKYGLGWEHARLGISLTDTAETMEHSGVIRAFRSNIFRIPSEKKCVILLSNCANQSAYDLFTQVIMNSTRRNFPSTPRAIFT